MSFDISSMKQVSRINLPWSMQTSMPLMDSDLMTFDLFLCLFVRDIGLYFLLDVFLHFFHHIYFDLLVILAQRRSDVPSGLVLE